MNLSLGWQNFIGFFQQLFRAIGGHWKEIGISLGELVAFFAAICLIALFVWAMGRGLRWFGRKLLGPMFWWFTSVCLNVAGYVRRLIVANRRIILVALAVVAVGAIAYGLQIVPAVTPVRRDVAYQWYSASVVAGLGLGVVVAILFLRYRGWRRNWHKWLSAVTSPVICGFIVAPLGLYTAITMLYCLVQD